jgi:hypothetical protein
MPGGSTSHYKEPESMEARLIRAAFVAVALVVSMGAKYKSANFIVDTADPRLAQQFADAAEKYRSQLALSWLGEELPKWTQPCPVKVLVGPHLGAGGATTFTFDRGQVFGWHMSIQGSRERVLDSVLPHEITHMIYASHFRRPLPRWADEGGATSVEHYSERNKQRAMLDQFLRTGRGIAFNTMFSMTEYPADVLPLYAQGYSTAEFLIQQGGRRKYIAFLDDGLKAGDWAAALQRNYNLQNLGQLQKTWLAWVKQGSPLKPKAPAPAAGVSPEMVAANGQPSRVDPNSVLRTREKTPPSPMPTAIPKTAPAAKNSEIAAAANVLPLRPLVPVSDKPNATLAPNTLASMMPTAKSIVDVPYTPGSTIAVSRLSIPSTGWRASYTTPLASTVASASQPTTAAPSDPYRTQVSRPQPLEGPTQTTMWR